MLYFFNILVLYFEIMYKTDKNIIVIYTFLKLKNINN